jgi:NPCBM/NEW2 domain-containing protein
MKTISVVFLMHLTIYLHAGDRIDLGDVQWTEASYSWTQDGKRLPVKNKNLMGNKICIAGIKYDKGLAGHTGFSVVYNLSGKALKFISIIGLDDESYPKDRADIIESNADIVILVDRKEVFRKNVIWKEKGIPISIDLKGAQQLELRGEYGKAGFPKQRIAFANPELVVINKSNFLEDAKKWYDKVELAKKHKLVYPPAPSWKTISIKKTSYQGWDNAYTINNGIYELIIVPEFGGRILSFKTIDGKNILTENTAFNKPDLLERKKCKVIHGGHFIRAQPRNYFHPGATQLAFGNYEIQFPGEGEIVMTSPKSYYIWLQFQFKITIKPNNETIHIENIHKNIAPFINRAGIWSITRLKIELIKAMIMPQEIKNPPRPYSFEPQNMLSKVTTANGWSTLKITQDLVKSFGQRGSIQWQLFPVKNEIKVQLPNAMFIKTFQLSQKDLKNMGEYCPAHFYISQKFLEAECHGPTVGLAPSAATYLKETWTIKKYKD